MSSSLFIRIFKLIYNVLGLSIEALENGNEFCSLFNRNLIANPTLFHDDDLIEELLTKGNTTDELATVSLKIYYTDKYREDVGGTFEKALEAISSLVAYCNKGFENSHIHLQYQVNKFESIQWHLTLFLFRDLADSVRRWKLAMLLTYLVDLMGSMLFIISL